MSTVRVTHTPCAQPVDITDDKRVLTPDTDMPHQCPVTEGRYSVVRHWARWSIQDVLDAWKAQPVFDTQAEAAAEADQRNKADNERRQRRTAAPPTQPDLFSSQETA